jgi:hypothetical protein
MAGFLSGENTRAHFRRASLFKRLLPEYPFKGGNRIAFYAPGENTRQITTFGLSPFPRGFGLTRLGQDLPLAKG